MRQDLDDALVRDFPSLYRERHMLATETCMCWGFPRDGWEPLIRTLSALLGGIVKRAVERGCPDAAVIAEQVKEKYGGLRFYYRTQGLSEVEAAQVEGAVAVAEDMSYSICEECGNAGKPGGSGWITTLCQTCRSAK